MSRRLLVSAEADASAEFSSARTSTDAIAHASAGAPRSAHAEPGVELVSVPVWAVHNRNAIVGRFSDTITVVLRAAGEPPRGEARPSDCQLQLLRRAQKAKLNECPLHLSIQQFVLLEHLVLNAGRVVDREQLRSILSHSRHAAGDVRLRELVHRLRAALGKRAGGHLRTVRNQGYVWDGEPATAEISDAVCPSPPMDG
jgi:hypothetical protein